MRKTFNCLCKLGKTSLLSALLLVVAAVGANAQSLAVSGRVTGNQGGQNLV